MKANSRAAFICAIATTSCCIWAQELEPVEILAEPLQYSQSGVFRGCGLNLKLMREENETTLAHLTLSLSFWLDTPGYGVSKIAFSRITTGRKPTVTRQPIGATWARIKPREALPMLKPVTGDDEAVLSPVPFDEGVRFVASVIEKEGEVQVGFKQAGQAHERVFYGRPVVAPETATQVLGCFDEFIQRLKSSRKQAKPG